ncbi:hypothetical protein BMETH_2385_0 [methanotrophic bacterial endosymbiont of Bathymodiolus sp.]|nr:hypothetical protein BMETH_2385_0 [methanotrophic bacterial endosymbiont of Bathymodiolus sp.]
MIIILINHFTTIALRLNHAFIQPDSSLAQFLNMIKVM